MVDPAKDNNSQDHKTFGEMFGGKITSPPTQNIANRKEPVLIQGGVGTTAISKPPLPKPSDAIPVSLSGSGVITKPPFRQNQQNNKASKEK